MPRTSHAARPAALLVSLALVVAACGPMRAGEGGTDTTGTIPVGQTDPEPTSVDQADGAQETSDMQLISTIATDADASAVGQAVNAFGFDLLAQLDAGAQTTITSPLSVATLLGMVLAGAGGDTATAIADVLHLDDPHDIRMGALLDLLTATDDVALEVTNGLWADPDTPFQQTYTDTVTEVFDASLTQADLGDPQTAEEIDAWVRAQTNDRIEGIAADLGLPDPQMVLVLLNAVYFLGEWTTAFDPALTTARPFTLPDDTSVEVPTMTVSDASFSTAQGDGYRMLRLPYGDDGRFGMEVLLPDANTDPAAGLASMVDGLDAEGWRATIDRLQPTPVTRLTLPSFQLEWSRSLRDDLVAMGMGLAFDDASDFTPMSPTDPVLDAVVHKTFIRVDEAGTEAAAVTGGAVRATSAIDPNEFLVDRPFAFTISDQQTGTILFLGTVTDPRG